MNVLLYPPPSGVSGQTEELPRERLVGAPGWRQIVASSLFARASFSNLAFALTGLFASAEEPLRRHLQGLATRD